MRRSLILFFIIFLVTPLHVYSDRVLVLPVDGEINPYLLSFLQRNLNQADDYDKVILEINTYGGLVDTALKISTLLGSLVNQETIAYIPASSGSTGVSWSAGSLIAFSCGAIYMGPGTSMGAAAPVYQTQEGMEMAPEKTVSAVRGQMAALAEKNGYPKNIAIAMVDKDLEVRQIFREGRQEFPDKDQLTLLANQGIPYEEGKLISPAGKLLTLTAAEAQSYGISRGTVSGYQEIWEYEGITEVVLERKEETSADQLINFITSAAVSSVLLMIALAALYIEVTSPGFGIPGTVALICFALLFGSSALLGTMGSLELLLFLLGVVLLLVEVFLIPGFGVTGISGLLLIGISLVLSRQEFIFPEFQWQWEEFRENLLTVFIGLAGSLGIMGVLLLFFPKLASYSRLVLQSTQEPAQGFISHNEAPFKDLPGSSGTALTPLRPVGSALIHNRKYTVTTEGEFLPKDSPIVVLRIENAQIWVKKGD